NATLYGDFILSEIIKRFERSDSIVIYFSDHGEEIYDFRNFIGHSDSKISRFMVEIPFIIYVSDSFIQKHPQLYKRIQKAQNQKYMNDDLMHTLLDIAGISLNGYESQRSLLATNKAFLKSRMRKVGDKSNVKDYDKELKTQKSYLEQGKCSIQGNN
ncbi:sulfatase-like hydrolase/transferase, partial [Helicobacter japonicus]